MLAIVGALILAGSVFYIVYTTQRAAEASAVENRLGGDLGDPNKQSFRYPFYISLTKPLLKGSYLDLAVGFWKPERLERWRVRLVSAGLGRYVPAEHFVAAKFWLTMAAAFFFLALQLFSAEPPSPGFSAAMVAACFFYPNLHVNSLRDQRQLEIRLAMPYVVDLLTLSIEAGLDFMGAIGKVVDRAPPSPLIEELSILLKDIQLGKTRAQALRAMADRIDMAEMSSFVAILISSDSMGASIGNVLRAQSDTMRTQRLNKAEKLGAQASQKILIPLIMFILPAVLLIIFGPIVLNMFGVGQ